MNTMYLECIYYFPFSPPKQLHFLLLSLLLLFFFITNCVQLLQPWFTWVLGHPLGHKQPTKDYTHKENWLLLSEQPSTFNSSSARSGTLGAPSMSLQECWQLGVKWVLYRHLLCVVHQGNGSVMPRRQFLEFTIFFSPPLFWCSLRLLGEGLWH